MPLESIPPVTTAVTVRSRKHTSSIARNSVQAAVLKAVVQEGERPRAWTCAARSFS